MIRGDVDEAMMMQALIAGYVAGSLMQMPLERPVSMDRCEAGQPIQMRLASGMLTTVTVHVEPSATVANRSTN